MYNQRLFEFSKQEDICKNYATIFKLYKIMQILEKLTKIIIDYNKNLKFCKKL